MDLDDFLVKAYAKQIKELNSSTGKKAHYSRNPHANDDAQLLLKALHATF